LFPCEGHRRRKLPQSFLKPSGPSPDVTAHPMVDWCTDYSLASNSHQPSRCTSRDGPLPSQGHINRRAAHNPRSCRAQSRHRATAHHPEASVVILSLSKDTLRREVQLAALACGSTGSVRTETIPPADPCHPREGRSEAGNPPSDPANKKTPAPLTSFVGLGNWWRGTVIPYEVVRRRRAAPRTVLSHL
jgi:hypothetical protein